MELFDRGRKRLRTLRPSQGRRMVPGRLIILTERNMQYRQIMLDGRALPKDPNLTWNGYSTGHLEGGTLVVETTGFRDDLWLNASGNPLTSHGA